MTGPLGWWFRRPLFLRICMGLLAGLIIGLIVGPYWNRKDYRLSPRWVLCLIRICTEVARLTLRMLSAIAPAMILLAVSKSLIATKIQGRMMVRLIYLLILNTVVAMCIGLLVAKRAETRRQLHISRRFFHSKPCGPAGDSAGQHPAQPAKPDGGKQRHRGHHPGDQLRPRRPSIAGSEARLRFERDLHRI